MHPVLWHPVNCQYITHAAAQCLLITAVIIFVRL